MRAWSLVFGAAVLPVLFLGCGSKKDNGPGDSDDGSGQGDGDGPTTKLQGLSSCTVNPTEVAGGACVENDDCPCGSFCSFGRCTVSCLDTSDCAEGEACNGFGYCSAASQAESPEGEEFEGSGIELTLPPVPALEERPDDRVELSPAIAVFGATSTARVAINVYSPTEVKLRASQPFLVRCRVDDEFASDCSLSAEELSDFAASVTVQIDPDAEAEGAVGELTAFSESRRATTSLEITTEVPVTSAVTPGLYRGRLSMDAVGRPGGGTAALMIRPYVEMEVFASGEVRLLETSGTLGLGASAGQELLGSITGNETDGFVLDFQSTRLLGAEPLGDVAEVVLDLEPTELASGGGYLTASLQGLYLGSAAQSDTEHAPGVYATLNVSRVGELPDSAVTPVLSPANLSINPLARSALRTAPERAIDLQTRCLKDEVTCAQHVICRQDGDALEVAESGDAYVLTTTTDGPHAELLCSSGRQQAFPLFAPDPESPAQELSTTLDQCLMDIRDFFEDTVPEEVTEEELDDLLSNNGCVSVYRFWAALGVLQGQVQAGNETFALTNRLWSQWFQTLTFIVNARMEITRAAAVGTVEQPIRSLSEVVDLTLGAAEMVLHPRLNRTLIEQGGASLAATDYRLVFGAVEPELPEFHSAPVFSKMLDLLSAQARGIARSGGSVCGGTSVSAQEDVVALGDEFLARAAPILASIEFLKSRAEGASPDGAWTNPWERSVALHVAARNELTDVLEACRESRNPIGISDLDLPLVFRDPEGASQRFSAISDFLIGTTPGSNAWVPSAIADAQEALDEVRDAWVAGVDRQLMATKIKDDQERREEAILRRYGEQIVAACGDANGLEVGDALTQTIDPSSCYVAAGCSGTTAEQVARVAPSDVAYDLCVAGKLQQHEGAALPGDDEDAKARLDAARKFLDYLSVQKDTTIPFARDGFEICLNDDSGSSGGGGKFDIDIGPICFPVAKFDNASNGLDEIGAALKGETISEITKECNAVRQRVVDRPFSIPSSCEVVEDCPEGFICDGAGKCQTKLNSNPDPSCFSGSLGENALALRSAALAIDAAKSEMAELSERYDIAMESCLIKRAANSLVAQELENHRVNMSRLRDAKASAAAAEGAFNLIGSLFNPNPFSWGRTIAKAGALGAKAAGGNIQGKMDKATDAHKKAVQRINAEKEEKVCFNDAQAHLVGARSAAIRIEAALNQSAEVLLRMQNQQEKLARLVRDGNAELERERATQVVPLEHDFYIDEKVDYYERKFRIAQRATYLAVRAFEYEYQACEGLRGEVIEAVNPKELDEVLDSLLAGSSAATLDGKRPSEGLAVVSLRDDILRIAPREDFEEFHQLTEEERFRVLVTSPRFAVFDAQGGYVGQRIPFSLAPLGDDSDAVSLLNGSSCAERLWSVNASLQGDGFMVDNESSFVEVTLEKKNTFFSSLCSGACTDGDGAGRQVASVRPSQNLFADPFFGATTGIDSSSGEDTAFSAARIRAYAGIDRATLETDDYENGDTSELAGRGLWGDYALFIRAADLSVDGSSGLALHKLDDILLRFDYVSVAND